MFEWTKGRLTRLYDDIDPNSSSSSDDYRFTYNAYGQRTSKVYECDPGDGASGDYMTRSTTNYCYDHSGRLINEITIEEYSEGPNIQKENIYLYDESGIIGVVYNRASGSNAYYFRRNLCGDVVAIYDKSGVRKAEYAYDAYGNCEIIYDASDTDIAEINPIRYRGYYYDRRTKLYYLNSRYYNPEWRRFISPDDTSYLDPDSVNGLNLYCYCNNDPVNYADPSGHFAISLVAGLVMGGLATWGLSELFGEHLVTGAGLAIAGGSATVSGIMAMSLFTPVGWIVGGLTAVAGIATTVFATAELQQHLTGNNWMIDAGMNESAYYTLMTVSSIVASVGTAASSIAYHYSLKSVIQKGRIDGKMISGKDIDGYPGLRFSSKTGKVYSLEFHPNHNNHGIHVQWNQWMQNYPKFPGENVLKPLWRFRIW